MRTFDELLSHIVNDLRYAPRDVIAAIDELCERRSEWTPKQWTKFSEAARKLKWLEHYPTVINDPNAALRDNPGFYIDFVLWVGWPEAKRAKDEGKWAEVAQKMNERGGRKENSMSIIDEKLAEFNDPALTEAINGLLLRFHLTLYGAAVSDGKTVIAGKDVERAAKRLARDEADGDKGLERSLYKLLMASYAGK